MDSIVKALKIAEDYGIHIGLIIAGVFGSIVSISHKRDLTKAQRFMAMLSGGIIANYVTPVIFEYININENTRYGFGCMLGFSGYEGMKFIIDRLKQKYSKKN